MLDQLTNLFEVTRKFSQVVCGAVQRELMGRVAAAHTLAHERELRIAVLENQLRSPCRAPPPAAPVIRPEEV